MLQRLEGAGIRTLRELKTEIDKLGLSESNAGERTVSASEKVKTFLAKFGHKDDIAEAHESEEGTSSRQKASAITQAMRALSSAPSAEEASLALSSSSADEDALQELARHSHELSPALANMRAWAVDKEIVESLASPGARASDAPLWSSSRATIGGRCLPGGATSGSTCTSIVLHNSEHALQMQTPMLLRCRLRRKTNAETAALSVPTLADQPVQEESRASLVPLLDGSCNCEPTQLAMEGETLRQRSLSHSKTKAACFMESITKKKKIVETDRKIIEVDTVIVKRVRNK